MGKILTFGEIMIRLQPEGYLRFRQATSLAMTYGGAEANVAVCLAQLRENATFFTKLPSNDLAEGCLAELRRHNVETDNILRGGDRLGIYFCEKGASQRPSKVIYDRANSAVTTLTVSEIDIEKLLKDVEWIHFSGITPALSDSVAEVTEYILSNAKKRNIKVSCDLNYRNKLWSREKAKTIMSGLMKYVDLLISNEEDCKDVFGLEAKNSDIDGGNLSVDGYVSLAKDIKTIFGIDTVAFTLRESTSASVNNWSGLLCKDGVAYVAKKHTINVVDRVGGGDSFAAGLIYALKNDCNGDYAINFAVSCSAIKHTIEGDFNMVTLEEVEKLTLGNGSGRVER